MGVFGLFTFLDPPLADYTKGNAAVVVVVKWLVCKIYIEKKKKKLVLPHFSVVFVVHCVHHNWPMTIGR